MHELLIIKIIMYHVNHFDGKLQQPKHINLSIKLQLQPLFFLKQKKQADKKLLHFHNY